MTSQSKNALNLQFILIILIAIVSGGVFIAALYLQHVNNESPCPLCVLQRYAYVATFLLAVILFAVRNHTLRLFLLATNFGATAAGFAIAIKQIWLRFHPALTCGFDATEPSVNQFFMARWFPNIFAAQGGCELPAAPLLGISVPTWSFITFVALLILILIAFFIEFRQVNIYSSKSL